LGSTYQRNNRQRAEARDRPSIKVSAAWNQATAPCGELGG